MTEDGDAACGREVVGGERAGELQVLMREIASERGGMGFEEVERVRESGG